MTEPFQFLDPGLLIDADLALVLLKKVPEDPVKKYVPVYEFEMCHTASKQKMGFIHLRVGDAEILKYAGHIGYGVDEPFRGHRYAARSVKLLFPLAKRHGLNEVWITCNPENSASRITCVYAGGHLIEIVDLPPENDQYQRGERHKCRYHFDLSV